MTSYPEPEESITTFNLATLTSTTNDDQEVKLDTSVVEQLVMAAVASLPTLTSTVLTTTTSEPNINIQLPPTPAPMDNNSSTTTTPTTVNQVTTPELNLTFTTDQLEQINQAQALAQAAAAAMAVSGTDYHQIFANLDAAAVVMNQQQQQQQQQLQNTNNEQQHMYKKETITQKVRQENRERKKRWRQQNQERNKDNDLRCRVNKRALKLFGKDDSPHKQKWIEEEFARRRAKRKEKEGRKHNLDSLPSPTPPTEEEAAALNGLLNDPSGYIHLLANTLANGTAAAAAGSSSSQLNNTTTNMDVDMKDDKSEQFTTQLLEFLQQQQQQQQQHDFAAAAALNIKEQVEPTVETQKQQAKDIEMEEQKIEVKEDPTVKKVETSQQQQQQQETKKDGQSVDYPMDAVLTLMQLNAGWRQ